jgi:hypothetical protein
MADLAEVLGSRVAFDGSSIPFGEVTVVQARERADELKAAVGFGPTARVAPVARAWRELMMEMQSAGVARVDGLPEATVMDLAPKLWIVPPGGSLL